MLSSYTNFFLLLSFFLRVDGNTILIALSLKADLLNSGANNKKNAVYFPHQL